MVARLVRDPFDREGWLFELKWDGFRTIAETDGTNGVKLYSRNQKDFKKRFSPIADELAKLKKAAILDGELVALDEHGHPRFEWLLNRGPQKGTLVYYVFDLLKLRDVAMFAGARALGVEGIVAKDAKSPYVEGPRVTWHWQKIKNRD